MNEQDDILNLIKNGGFLIDFIMENERQKAFNVSIINSECDELLATSPEERTTEYLISFKEKIFNHCSQMLKFFEIITKLSRLADENEISIEKIDISKFLSEFANECQTQLKGKCEFDYKQGSDDVTEIVKELLELCLLMYVRKAILKGAKFISFTNTSELDYVVIHAEITKFGESAVAENIRETFTLDYADGIISSIVNKLNGKTVLSDKEMKLYIPLKNSGYSTLNSSKRTYGKSAFSIYKNMLSDLSDITII